MKKSIFLSLKGKTYPKVLATTVTFLLCLQFPVPVFAEDNQNPLNSAPPPSLTNSMPSIPAAQQAAPEHTSTTHRQSTTNEFFLSDQPLSPPGAKTTASETDSSLAGAGSSNGSFDLPTDSDVPLDVPLQDTAVRSSQGQSAQETAALGLKQVKQSGKREEGAEKGGDKQAASSTNPVDVLRLAQEIKEGYNSLYNCLVNNNCPQGMTANGLLANNGSGIFSRLGELEGMARQLRTMAGNVRRVTNAQDPGYREYERFTGTFPQSLADIQAAYDRVHRYLHNNHQPFQENFLIIPYEEGDPEEVVITNEKTGQAVRVPLERVRQSDGTTVLRIDRRLLPTNLMNLNSQSLMDRINGALRARREIQRIRQTVILASAVDDILADQDGNGAGADQVAVAQQEAPPAPVPAVRDNHSDPPEQIGYDLHTANSLIRTALLDKERSGIKGVFNELLNAIERLPEGPTKDALKAELAMLKLGPQLLGLDLTKHDPDKLAELLENRTSEEGGILRRLVAEMASLYLKTLLAQRGMQLTIQGQIPKEFDTPQETIEFFYNLAQGRVRAAIRDNNVSGLSFLIRRVINGLPEEIRQAMTQELNQVKNKLVINGLIDDLMNGTLSERLSSDPIAMESFVGKFTEIYFRALLLKEGLRIEMRSEAPANPAPNPQPPLHRLRLAVAMGDAASEVAADAALTQAIQESALAATDMSASAQATASPAEPSTQIVQAFPLGSPFLAASTPSTSHGASNQAIDFGERRAGFPTTYDQNVNLLDDIRNSVRTYLMMRYGGMAVSNESIRITGSNIVINPSVLGQGERTFSYDVSVTLGGQTVNGQFRYVVVVNVPREEPPQNQPPPTGVSQTTQVSSPQAPANTASERERRREEFRSHLRELNSNVRELEWLIRESQIAGWLASLVRSATVGETQRIAEERTDPNKKVLTDAEIRQRLSDYGFDIRNTARINETIGKYRSQLQDRIARLTAYTADGFTVPSGQRYTPEAIYGLSTDELSTIREEVRNTQQQDSPQIWGSRIMDFLRHNLSPPQTSSANSTSPPGGNEVVTASTVGFPPIPPLAGATTTNMEELNIPTSTSETATTVPGLANTEPAVAAAGTFAPTTPATNEAGMPPVILPTGIAAMAQQAFLAALPAAAQPTGVSPAEPSPDSASSAITGQRSEVMPGFSILSFNMPGLTVTSTPTAGVTTEPRPIQGIRIVGDNLIFDLGPPDDPSKAAYAFPLPSDSQEVNFFDIPLAIRVGRTITTVIEPAVFRVNGRPVHQLRVNTTNGQTTSISFIGAGNQILFTLQVPPASPSPPPAAVQNPEPLPAPSVNPPMLPEPEVNTPSPQEPSVRPVTSPSAEPVAPPAPPIQPPTAETGENKAVEEMNGDETDDENGEVVTVDDLDLDLEEAAGGSTSTGDQGDPDQELLDLLARLEESGGPTLTDLLGLDFEREASVSLHDIGMTLSSDSVYLDFITRLEGSTQIQRIATHEQNKRTLWTQILSQWRERIRGQMNDAAWNSAWQSYQSNIAEANRAQAALYQQYYAALQTAVTAVTRPHEENPTPQITHSENFRNHFLNLTVQAYGRYVASLAMGRQGLREELNAIKSAALRVVSLFEQMETPLRNREVVLVLSAIAQLERTLPPEYNAAPNPLPSTYTLTGSDGTQRTGQLVLFTNTGSVLPANVMQPGVAGIFTAANYVLMWGAAGLSFERIQNGPNITITSHDSGTAWSRQEGIVNPNPPPNSEGQALADPAWPIWQNFLPQTTYLRDGSVVHWLTRTENDTTAASQAIWLPPQGGPIQVNLSLLQSAATPQARIALARQLAGLIAQHAGERLIEGEATEPALRGIGQSAYNQLDTQTQQQFLVTPLALWLFDLATGGGLTANTGLMIGPRGEITVGQATGQGLIPQWSARFMPRQSPLPAGLVADTPFLNFPLTVWRYNGQPRPAPATANHWTEYLPNGSGESITHNITAQPYSAGPTSRSGVALTDTVRRLRAASPLPSTANGPFWVLQEQRALQPIYLNMDGTSWLAQVSRGVGNAPLVGPALHWVGWGVSSALWHGPLMAGNLAWGAAANDPNRLLYMSQHWLSSYMTPFAAPGIHAALDRGEVPEVLANVLARLSETNPRTMLALDMIVRDARRASGMLNRQIVAEVTPVERARALLNYNLATVQNTLANQGMGNGAILDNAIIYGSPWLQFAAELPAWIGGFGSLKALSSFSRFTAALNTIFQGYAMASFGASIPATIEELFHAFQSGDRVQIAQGIPHVANALVMAYITGRHVVSYLREIRSQWQSRNAAPVDPQRIAQEAINQIRNLPGGGVIEHGPPGTRAGGRRGSFSLADITVGGGGRNLWNLLTGRNGKPTTRPRSEVPVRVTELAEPGRAEIPSGRRIVVKPSTNQAFEVTVGGKTFLMFRGQNGKWFIRRANGSVVELTQPTVNVHDHPRVIFDNLVQIRFGNTTGSGVPAIEFQNPGSGSMTVRAVVRVPARANQSARPHQVNLPSLEAGRVYEVRFGTSTYTLEIQGQKLVVRTSNGVIARIPTIPTGGRGYQNPNAVRIQFDPAQRLPIRITNLSPTDMILTRPAGGGVQPPPVQPPPNDSPGRPQNGNRETNSSAGENPTEPLPIRSSRPPAPPPQGLSNSEIPPRPPRLDHRVSIDQTVPVPAGQAVAAEYRGQPIRIKIGGDYYDLTLNSSTGQFTIRGSGGSNPAGIRVEGNQITIDNLTIQVFGNNTAGFRFIFERGGGGSKDISFTGVERVSNPFSSSSIQPPAPVTNPPSAPVSPPPPAARQEWTSIARDAPAVQMPYTGPIRITFEGKRYFILQRLDGRWSIHPEGGSMSGPFSATARIRIGERQLDINVTGDNVSIQNRPRSDQPTTTAPPNAGAPPPNGQIPPSSTGGNGVAVPPGGPAQGQGTAPPRGGGRQVDREFLEQGTSPRTGQRSSNSSPDPSGSIPVPPEFQLDLPPSGPTPPPPATRQPASPLPNGRGGTGRNGSAANPNNPVINHTPGAPGRPNARPGVLNWGPLADATTRLGRTVSDWIAGLFGRRPPPDVTPSFRAGDVNLGTAQPATPSAHGSFPDALNQASAMQQGRQGRLPDRTNLTRRAANNETLVIAVDDGASGIRFAPGNRVVEVLTVNGPRQELHVNPHNDLIAVAEAEGLNPSTRIVVYVQPDPANPARQIPVRIDIAPRYRSQADLPQFREDYRRVGRALLDVLSQIYSPEIAARVQKEPWGVGLLPGETLAQQVRWPPPGSPVPPAAQLTLPTTTTQPGAPPRPAPAPAIGATQTPNRPAQTAAQLAPLVIPNSGGGPLTLAALLEHLRTQNPGQPVHSVRVLRGQGLYHEAHVINIGGTPQQNGTIAGGTNIVVKLAGGVLAAELPNGMALARQNLGLDAGALQAGLPGLPRLNRVIHTPSGSLLGVMMEHVPGTPLNQALTGPNPRINPTEAARQLAGLYDGWTRNGYRVSDTNDPANFQLRQNGQLTLVDPAAIVPANTPSAMDGVSREWFIRRILGSAGVLPVTIDEAIRNLNQTPPASNAPLPPSAQPVPRATAVPSGTTALPATSPTERMSPAGSSPEPVRQAAVQPGSDQAQNTAQRLMQDLERVSQEMQSAQAEMSVLQANAARGGATPQDATVYQAARNRAEASMARVQALYARSQRLSSAIAAMIRQGLGGYAPSAELVTQGPAGSSQDRYRHLTAGEETAAHS